MAKEQKAARKAKEKPPGYDTWSPNRKALYRAAGYVKRVRALLRSAASNLDDAAVMASSGGSDLSHDEYKEMRKLQAEASVALQHMGTAGQLIGACLTELDKRDGPATLPMPRA